MSYSPLHTLDTPSLVLDEATLDANIARMQTRADELGVGLRPHVKTSKSIAVAQRQRDAGARGITVSTLKEAQQFFDAGFNDILYAVTVAPQKIEPALALMRRGCDLKLLVDSVAAAQAIADAVRRDGRHGGGHVPVLIEIDTDGHRSGVAPEAPLLLDIGRALHGGGLALAGVMTHAGSSYDCRSAQELQRVAGQERDGAVRAAERLRAAGLPCPVVSVGSTPTALAAPHLHGVTELRAGVYVFFDLVMAGVGVCSSADIALSVLTTVIGHQPERGWAIVDAGWMALSRDRGTQTQAQDQGYGLVCDEAGRPIDALVVSAANQEHGIVAARSGAALHDIAARLPLGTRLRVLPNHACATAAQHERYHLVRDNRLVADWPRFNGW